MNFRITGLDPAPFRHLCGLTHEALEQYAAERHIVDCKPGFPDRITLCDMAPGETALLVNYMHQPATNPYRASHAIFIREDAQDAYDRVNEIPESMRQRLMSLRAFNANDHMIDAEVGAGDELTPLITQLLANPEVSYIQAHYAKRGCYAARIERT